MTARSKLARAAPVVALVSLVALAVAIVVLARERARAKHRVIELQPGEALLFVKDGAGVCSVMKPGVALFAKALDPEPTKGLVCTVKDVGGLTGPLFERFLAVSTRGDRAILFDAHALDLEAIPLFDQTARRKLANLPSHVFCAAISPDDSFVALGLVDRIMVLSMKDGSIVGKPIVVAPPLGPAKKLTFSPDGLLLLVEDQGDRWVYVGSWSDGMVKTKFVPGGILGFSNHGEVVRAQPVSSDKDAGSVTLETSDGLPVRRITINFHQPVVRQIEVAALGERILVHRSERVDVISIDSGKTVWTTPVAGLKCASAISPRGDRVAISGAGGEPKGDVWELP